MAGFKLALEGGELSYGRSAVVCYEKMGVGGWRGPAFVVLRQRRVETSHSLFSF